MFQVVRTGKPKNRRIWPEEYPYREVKKRVCTFDTETDPFKEGRIIKPFCAGFHLTDTGEYYEFWGDDCIEQFFAFLDEHYSSEKLVIYAHNGGNFDFYFMLDHFDDGMKPFIINGRLARVIMHGQEFRDSYAAVPVALEKYKKTEIDYDIFERPVRETHRTRILSYMRDDCIYLGHLITEWLRDFGNKTTMASVALPMLKSRHGFECMLPASDDLIRPYYFGGRVQCFESGVIKDDWKVYDVNSMYPSVMRDFEHPISNRPISKRTITEKTAYAHIRAHSVGALPIRSKSGSLVFPDGTNDFFACIHEIRAAEELGLLKIHKVYQAWSFDAWTTFGDFIDEFYKLRQDARSAGDTIHDIFFKLVMNSSYGKLAQDPRKYRDYVFNPEDTPKPLLCIGCLKHGHTRPDCAGCGSGQTSLDGWTLESVRAGKSVYSRPQTDRAGTGFFNVATAASITSAARAQLLKGIAGADRPIYCDTDSLICRDIRGVTIDPDILGAWKIEASGSTACIAGKKLYAIYSGEDEIKKASKGVRLTADQIRRVAKGEVIVYTDPVPKFKLDGTADIDRTRTIRMTVDD